jgi:1,2-diacylglycerol 3-alpha-glucosyltransferase
MKIAMFTDYFFPELGGIQDSIATIGQALGRRGHDIEIHAPRYGRPDYLRSGPGGEPDLGVNVRVHRHPSLPFPSSTRQSRAALISPLGWVRLGLSGKPDLIHVHSFFGIGLEALFNGLCLRVPVIGTNHTTVAGFAPYIPVNAGVASAYVRWFYNRCDLITAPSRSVFEELGASKLRPPERVVSNPIDTGLFTPASPDERAALKARFGLSRETVTYAGRLGPEKSIDVLLRAIALLDVGGAGPDLAIAGHGSHEATLRSLAADLGVARRVRFLGTLRHAELADLLRISDIFAIMSTSETQSMVMVQAMASGVPVVAAASRALREYVDSTCGVLVEPHDHAALAQALAELLGSPERRRVLGCGGRRAARKCEIETIADEWEQLYRSVLDRGSNA